MYKISEQRALLITSVIVSLFVFSMFFGFLNIINTNRIRDLQKENDRLYYLQKEYVDNMKYIYSEY